MALVSNDIVASLLQYRLHLVTVAVAIVRNPHDADDLFQQVVLNALRSGGPFDDEHHLLAWATRAIRHRAIDLARKKPVVLLSNGVLDLLEAEWSDPTGPAQSDAAEALGRCVDHLGRSARTVLRMKFLDGLSVSAIADRLGRTTDAVYQMLSRTQRVLRTCVERQLQTSPASVSGGVP